VDNKLLDLVPEAAEKLMIAFRSVASDHREDWSRAGSCRKFIENLADELYPAKDAEVKGRKLGQAQYINRLWAFMDASIESDSNRDLAKAHVDYLGMSNPIARTALTLSFSYSLLLVFTIVSFAQQVADPNFDRFFSSWQILPLMRFHLTGRRKSRRRDVHKALHLSPGKDA